ncbi:hypothetical protein ACYEXS_23020 [Paenibacillus sp. MAH-36]|uniref:Uncharacterized protein n=1 Tax=Paenibacillus violae TaxID=3077234 RepID=A0ABU3RA84_9BACL|nr:hypothetical protein [Paenibacillus sp. PFR10]MDU0201176.1 hypothetical protein [Paenibacillus sp. PFR10]
MRIWIGIWALFVVFTSGCSWVNSNSIHGNAVIDWVDFVKLSGNSYTGLFEGVIKDTNDITNEVVGEVHFKVGDVVTNPEYQTKAGDAAFLEIGTKLYKVKGFESNQLIAAKDEKRISGYRLYAGDDFARTLRRNYEDLPKEKIERVELYHFDEVKPYKTLNDSEKEQFIQLLESGKVTEDYYTQSKVGDPTYYLFVIFTNEPIANSFILTDDGGHVSFSSTQTRIVDNEIRKLILPFE